MTPEECSQCGESIPRGALACPSCGADERTGWDENPYLETEHLLPDDAPYEETWTRKRWILAALIVLLAMIYMLMQRGKPI